MIKSFSSKMRAGVLACLFSFLMIFSASAKICFLPNVENCDNVNATASQTADNRCQTYINDSSYFATNGNLSNADCPCNSDGTYYCKCNDKYIYDGDVGVCVERCPNATYNLTEPKGTLWECLDCFDGETTRYGSCICNYTVMRDGRCTNEGQCSDDEYIYANAQVTTMTSLGYTCNVCEDETSWNYGKSKCSCVEPNNLNDSEPAKCIYCSTANTPQEYYTKAACNDARTYDERCIPDAKGCWIRSKISCDYPQEPNQNGSGECICPENGQFGRMFATKPLCEADLATRYGQANAFDWRGALYEVAQCLLPVKPAYAQQVNTQPSVTPEINGGNGYQQQTDTGETPELAGDDGYQQHMSQEAICKEKCKSQKATNFNKCVQACLGLALDENLDDFERVVGDWEFECVDCDNEPEPTTNEPTSTDQYECVQEGACWKQVKKTPTCNESNYQYTSYDDCDREWHHWWRCDRNTTTGCYHPVCDGSEYSEDYYDDEQDCVHYGTQDDGACEIVLQTQGTGVECYRPVPGGTVQITCDDYEHDYGQFSPNQGCRAMWGDVLNASGDQVYTWQGQLGNEEVELGGGIYKLVYKNEIRHGYQGGYGLYGFTGFFKVNAQRYVCGYTSNTGLVRKVQCSRHCLCLGSNSTNIIDCYYDYEITFSHSSGTYFRFYPFAGNIWHESWGNTYLNEDGANTNGGKFSQGNGECSTIYTPDWSN